MPSLAFCSAALRRRTRTLRNFAAAETGAVSVDWVVLSAAVVGLGIATAAAVGTGALSLGSGVEDSLANAQVAGSGSGTVGGTPWAPLQWTQHNPGIYDSYRAWMESFTDESLIGHMTNMQQFSDYPPNSGHPYDTYHDEYWIARDIAIERNLISA